jgi:hypothetical protein
MPDKLIYELAEEDFREHGVWYFPMDDDDWDIVRPCLAECDTTSLVRTTFRGADGTRYSGYVYWCPNNDIGYIQPNLFLPDGSSMTFWSGIIKASWEGVAGEAARLAYPITFESEPLLGNSPMTGQIDGLYYFDDDKQVQCLLPP